MDCPPSLFFTAVWGRMFDASKAVYIIGDCVIVMVLDTIDFELLKVIHVGCRNDNSDYSYVVHHDLLLI